MSVTWPHVKDSKGAAVTYEILKNGKTLIPNTPSTNAYGDYDIVADNLYSYQIRAKDSAGKYSAYSASANTTIRCFWIFCSLQ